ncbi:MAG: TAXI family TRAP transporter solute-binding subunit [Notoacmeibacter sp.]|nr:TAXI family TRAP transporter solute-binding subunit [Notoacmeibacter sp.]
MTLKKTLLGMVAAGVIAASPALAEDRISIGTGGTGGLFYVIGAGMAEIINKHMDGATARAEVTGASVENIRRAAADQVTFGFSSASTLYEATKGTGPFKDGALDMSAMAYLYPAVMQIATLEGTGAKTLDDLAGKRISLGPPGSNSAVLCQRILEEKGVFDQANAQFLSYTESTKALVDGNLDAACVLAGAPVAALIDLDAKADMVMIPVDDASMKGLIEKYPFYQSFEIKAGTYSDQKEAVAVVNDPATLFAKTGADAALIGKVVGTIFSNLEELHAVHPAAKRILRATATNVPVPLHPGAKAWFDANP